MGMSQFEPDGIGIAGLYSYILCVIHIDTGDIK